MNEFHVAPIDSDYCTSEHYQHLLSVSEELQLTLMTARWIRGEMSAADLIRATQVRTDEHRERERLLSAAADPLQICAAGMESTVLREVLTTVADHFEAHHTSRESPAARYDYLEKALQCLPPYDCLKYLRKAVPEACHSPSPRWSDTERPEQSPELFSLYSQWKSGQLDGEDLLCRLPETVTGLRDRIWAEKSGGSPQADALRLGQDLWVSVQTLQLSQIVEFCEEQSLLSAAERNRV